MDDAAGGYSAATGLRVLIVDDNDDSAASFAMLCRIDGHDVRTAHDGAEGLASAREFVPDAVFLDIGLPDMTGYRVAEQMRRLPPLEKAMLVALTGFDDPEHQDRSHRAGFDHHVVKPADHSHVRRLLDRLAAAACRR